MPAPSKSTGLFTVYVANLLVVVVVPAANLLVVTVVVANLLVFPVTAVAAIGTSGY